MSHSTAWSDAKTFAGLLVTHWVTGMCGAFGLLFTVSGFFWSNETAHRIFEGTGVACLIYVAFDVWRREYNMRRKALEPILGIASDAVRSESPSTPNQGYYRIRIHNSAKVGCRFRVQLEKIHPEAFSFSNVPICMARHFTPLGPYTAARHVVGDLQTAVTAFPGHSRQ
jgi:hypothetical protein